MKNLQYLATDLFKVKNGHSLEIMKIILFFKKMKIRSGNHLAQKDIQITQYKIENSSNLEAKLWDLLTGSKKIVLPFLSSKIK